jgi:short-subunit dehydrogenase
MDYFVTGATGFIGRYLVKNLLDRNAVVHVLVRAGSRDKIDALREWWGDHANNVHVVEGDLGQHRLGLSALDRDRLRGGIDHFFHLAALYDLDASAVDMEVANVAGTRHALELAHDLEVGCFHLCSSIAAAGLYPGVFREDMFAEAQGLEHPYFNTKHESEALVRKHTHLHWRIYRPGMVVGHSATGHITKADGPYLFFKALQTLRRNWPGWLPLVGIEGGHINLVPVDYVITAMLYLAHLDGHDHECFHLTDPRTRSAGEVLNLFARAGHAPPMQLRLDARLLQLVPQQVSDALTHYEPLKLMVQQLLDDLHLPKSVLDFLNYPTRFDCERTQHLLRNTGIQVPLLEDYAWRLWDYWERHLDPDLSIDRSLKGRVKGRRVLITGGSSGIGKATALKLADAGAHVLLVARDLQKLIATQNEIVARGGQVSIYACDITDAAASQQLSDKIIATHGGVDVLINNAGRSIRRSIAISYDRFHDFERLMELNYYAAVRLTLALLPGMVAQHNGHVIVISSIGVLSNAPRFSGYIASKAALEAFTRCAAAEYRDQGIYFTVINMPLVRTPMIAPTRAYEQLPTISADEAATLVADAVIHQPPRLATRLGMFAQLMQLFAPKLSDVIMNASHHMFPDSAAAKGNGAPEEPPGPEAVAFAKLLSGLHW